MKKYIALILIIVTLPAACSKIKNNLVKIPTLTVSSSYPEPKQLDIRSSGVPYPDPIYGNDQEEIQVYATSGPIPVPSSDYGVVMGKLLVVGKPVVNIYVVLGLVSKDEQGLERVASYDPQTSPRSLTDEEGFFVLANVSPGRYGLILDSVLTSALLHDPQTNIPIVITVEAGKKLDLGTLDYETLPVPEELIGK